MKGSENKIKDLKTATFGAGCFWCIEAVFEQLKGVVSVKSGYAGGIPKIRHIKKSVQEKQGMPRLYK